MELSNQILSDITVYMKYARYSNEHKRRETWEELVTRNMEMHIRKYPDLEEEIRKNYQFVYDRKVLPSMRSLQFGGKPIEISPNRIYNCAYLPIDDWRAFSEIMFLLLGGCFSEDTEIITAAGKKQIKDVTVNDKVLTFDTDTKTYQYVTPFCVLQTPSENKDKFELTFSDGSIVKCTEDHKFLTKNRGWVEAKDLDEYDEIEEFTGQDANFLEFSAAEIESEYKPVFQALFNLHQLLGKKIKFVLTS